MFFGFALGGNLNLGTVLTFVMAVEGLFETPKIISTFQEKRGEHSESTQICAGDLRPCGKAPCGGHGAFHSCPEAPSRAATSRDKTPLTTFPLGFCCSWLH